MPDKMLRIAGRGEDGLGKAIKTDENGIQFIRPIRDKVKTVTVDGIISPSTTEIVAETTKGCYIEEITCWYENDTRTNMQIFLKDRVNISDTNHHGLGFVLGTGSFYATSLYRPTDLRDRYDQRFDLVIDNPNDFVIAFKPNTRIYAPEGFRIIRANSNTTTEYKMTVKVVWTEIGGGI